MGAGERIPPAIAPTWHGRVLDALYDLYDELDREVERFQRSSRLGCPEGCGVCCAGYEPAVLPVEGMAVAAWVEHAGASPAAIRSAAAEDGVGCVFADPLEALHCTVYPARPLECRLFAFSGVRGKSGEPRFRLCRHMAGPRETSAGAAIVEVFGSEPPLMPDWSARLQALGSPAAPAPLRLRAREAWQMVRHLLELQRAGSD